MYLVLSVQPSESVRMRLVQLFLNYGEKVRLHEALSVQVLVGRDQLDSRALNARLPCDLGSCDCERPSAWELGRQALEPLNCTGTNSERYAVVDAEDESRGPNSEQEDGQFRDGK